MFSYRIFLRGILSYGMAYCGMASYGFYSCGIVSNKIPSLLCNNLPFDILTKLHIGYLMPTSSLTLLRLN